MRPFGRGRAFHGRSAVARLDAASDRYSTMGGIVADGFDDDDLLVRFSPPPSLVYRDR